MYVDLGSTKENIALSPREALDSAAALLVQQGYEVTQRTDTSLTAIRRKREGMFGHSLLTLTVVVLPQPEGGVQVKLRGDDREGVQDRQAEWSRWAEDLPKIEAVEQDEKRTAGQAPSTETREISSEETKPDTAESRNVGDRPLVASEHEDQQSSSGVHSDEQRKDAPPTNPSPWISATGWEPKARVTPGKHEDVELPKESRVSEPLGLGASDEKKGEDSDMTDGKDISHLLERLEAFEDRLGVRLEGLYASSAEYGGLNVNGELHPRGGTELDDDIDIVITLYDSAGRVLEVETAYVDSENFFGFEAFSKYFSRAGVPPVAKIRIYPKVAQ